MKTQAKEKSKFEMMQKRLLIVKLIFKILYSQKVYGNNNNNNNNIINNKSKRESHMKVYRMSERKEK